MHKATIRKLEFVYKGYTQSGKKATLTNKKGVRKMMKEAILKSDFERQERGLPPKAQPKRKVEEPKPPKVPDEISFADIPETEIFDFSARRRIEKNSEGTHFTGYSVFIEFRDNTTLQGWLIESDFVRLKGRLQGERPELLKKIGL